MRFLKEGDKGAVKNIDASTKNKWSWKWIDETIECHLDRIGHTKYTLGKCFRKIDIPGVAWCLWCEDKINYGGNGKKHLISHCSTDKHVARLKIRASNYTLGGAGPSSTELNQQRQGEGAADNNNRPYKNVFSIFKNTEVCRSTTVASGSIAGPVPDEDVDPLVPVSDRTANTEAMILGFIAENSLPLSLAGSLTKLIQEASRDPQAIANLALSKQTAANKMNFGLGKTFTDELVAKLKTAPFSLNIDEATNDHGKKVLSLLVSFFDETTGKIAVHHLASVELVKTDAKSIHKAIVSVIEGHEIPWSNLMSVLLDSCNVMRGAKAGVEVLLRQNCNNLLNIDGDTCHHVHNITKALCEPFNFWLERLFIDLHLDFKYCTQYRKIMTEICRICHVNFTAPKRFVSHRWLNAYDQAIETSRLFDLYVIFYSAFLPIHLKGQFRRLVDTLVQKIETHAAQERVRSLLSLLQGKQSVTPVGKARKERILDRIFLHQERTLLQLKLYQAWMYQMKMFVLRFQSREPLIHKLHDDLLRLAREFLVKFVESKHLKGKTATELKKIDLKQVINLNEEEIFLGSDTRDLLNVADEKVKVDFLSSVKEGYIKAGQTLLRKLPLDNTTIEAISFLNPDKRTKSGSISGLTRLINLFSHVLTDDEKLLAEEEVSSFVSDDCLSTLGDGRVDLWWDKANSIPNLKRVAKAALSIFHGPQVESSFSLMKDVMGKKSGSMSVSTFSSIQTVKYHLKSKQTTAAKYFQRGSINHTPVPRDLVINLQSATKQHVAKLNARKQELDAEIQTLHLTKIHIQTASEAKRLKEKAIKQANKVHQRRALKRKHMSSAGSAHAQKRSRL